MFEKSSSAKSRRRVYSGPLTGRVKAFENQQLPHFFDTAVLLTETTAIAFGGLVLILPVLLVLYIPTLVLARLQSSTTSKVVALTLALVIILVKHWALADLGSLAALFFYLPLGVVVVNMARSAAK
jgi:hypothetical protein